MRSMLIHTIAARDGGVPQMVRFALETLHADGWHVELAYYEPYSQSPDLSTPSFALGRRRPGCRRESGLSGVPAHAMGAWLPELEFTHYWPRKQWRALMAQFSHHLVVSGNALAGTAVARSGQAYTAWIATDFDGDRKDRIASFPWPRRMVDRLLNGPVARHLERQVLRKGAVLALSGHTRLVLNKAAGEEVVRDVLPAPIDCDVFRPDADKVLPGRIGFSGRLNDPRKNLTLLLDALELARSRGAPLTAVLIGCAASPELQEALNRRKLTAAVELLPYMDQPSLAMELRRLDVYALPSHQEGLCIAALEAMASAVPVVSTRCGGPEDYVRHGENGFLTDFRADEMAELLVRIVADRRLRDRLARTARADVERNYSRSTAAAVLLRTIHEAGPASQDQLELA